MTYCPEHGGRMRPAHIGYHACYDCRRGGEHWFYNGDRGEYWLVDERERCPQADRHDNPPRRTRTVSS